MAPERNQQIGWKDQFIQDGFSHLAKCHFPFLSMAFHPVPELTVDLQVSDFVNVRQQKQIGMQVPVDRDPRGTSRMAGKIAHLCMATLPQFEIKRLRCPQTKAIVYCPCREVLQKE